jgi:hypothetical protein
VAAAPGTGNELTSAVGSTLPLPLPPPMGTTWVSKTTTAVTRKDIGTRLAKSGVPSGSFGTPNRRSVPPGPMCSTAASWESITAWPAAFGPNIRPCSTFTLSVVTPKAWSGLDMAVTPLLSACLAPGSATWYRIAVDIPATCGSLRRAA